MPNILADSVRPVLTYFAFFLYIGVSTYGVLHELIDFQMYFAQVGTMVSMMVSFWFGEKSALKNPRGEL